MHSSNGLLALARLVQARRLPADSELYATVIRTSKGRDGRAMKDLR